MRAARYYGNSDIRIEEIDEPTVGAGEVGIDVAWCGICGTDLHEYKDGPIFCPSPGHPHPISGRTPRSRWGTNSPASSTRSARVSTI